MSPLNILRTTVLSLVTGVSLAHRCDRTVTRDVAIIGGGASGAHAAVRLREDFNKSVIVVEKENRLVRTLGTRRQPSAREAPFLGPSRRLRLADSARQGGHVATYTDYAGKAYEYGVQSYFDVGGAVDFFARFNITVGAPERISLTNVYADFSTGEAISDYVTPEATDRTEALNRFLKAAEPYESMLLPGYWEFPAPEDIPEDLLLPFGEFAKKYGFEAAMPQMFQVPGPVPDFTGALTLHVMQVFGAPMARALTGDAPTFTPTEVDNTELYRRIETLLGDDVLYSSTITGADRGENGVKLTARDAGGEEIIIEADRLLIAFEPTSDAMASFDLDRAESAVFEKWESTRVFAGIVRHPSLPVNISIVNTVPEAAPDNYLAFPQSPILARFDYMGPPSDLFRVLIVTDGDLSVDGALELVRSSLANLSRPGRWRAAT